MSALCVDVPAGPIARDDAAAAIIVEHERVCGVLMLTIDAFDEAQASEEQLNAQVLRRLNGPMMRRSMLRLKTAVAKLSDDDFTDAVFAAAQDGSWSVAVENEERQMLDFIESYSEAVE